MAKKAKIICAVAAALLVIAVGTVIILTTQAKEESVDPAPGITWQGRTYFHAEKDTTRTLPAGYIEIGRIAADPGDKSGVAGILTGTQNGTATSISEGTKVYADLQNTGLIYLKDPDKPYYDPYSFSENNTSNTP